MRILFVADGHSPIARAWIEEVARRGHEVVLVTTHPAPPLAVEIPTREVLVGFSGLRRGGDAAGVSADLRRRSLVERLARGRTAPFLREARWRLAALDVVRHRARCRRLIEGFAPDLVHAMRITFEGALAALATPKRIPLVVSVWGNEFTLHAQAGRVAVHLIRRTIARADALTADCARDLRLARQEWAFAAERPAALLPGAGGVDPQRFRPGAPDPALRRSLTIPDDAEVVINPRGLRSYVCSEVFYRALPVIAAARPKLRVIAPGTAESGQVRQWLECGGVADRVVRLPAVAQPEMAELFRLAPVSVSPSLHDGTPNSLLEAMACGSFPVAGDIESLREWIRHGENGLLCDPRDPEAIAAAVVRALADESLRRRARAINLDLVRERAQRESVMDRAEAFYEAVLERRQGAMLAGAETTSRLRTLGTRVRGCVASAARGSGSVVSEG